jgi:quercetin dioxygenase-like cupin family protein
MGFNRYPKHARGLKIAIADKFQGQKMKIVRRELLYLAGVAAALPSLSKIAWAQTQAPPKLTQILRKDLEDQGQVVQETIVSVVDFGPGTAAPWHMHPGAQELLHVIEGSLVMEVEGAGTTVLKTGEAAIIAADLVHLARNENTSASVKALVVHSRAAKDKPLMVVVNK